MKRISLLAVAVCLWSCQHTQKSRIIGKDLTLSAGKVYICDANSWEKILDSAGVKNGNFVFELPDSMSPYYASVFYLDGNGQRQLLAVVNDFMKNNGHKRSAGTGFMWERGDVILTADAEASPYHHVTLKGGLENRLEQRFTGKDVCAIDRSSPDKKVRSLKRVQEFVKKYSSSYYVLRNFKNGKYAYTKSELLQTFNLFDKDVRQSALGRELTHEIGLRPDEGEAIPDLSLTDDRGMKVFGINRKASFNMLVFWSSCCKPCRQEIPALKKIYSAFGQKDNFYMASISLDKDSHYWKMALNKEQMDWEQYWADSSEHEVVSAAYNIGWIPIIVLLDEKGVELKRYDGFAPGMEEEIMRDIQARR